MGYYQNLEPVEVLTSTGITVSKENTGVAAVIPATLILEILNCDKLRKRRGEL
jgi:hypothetical protein